MPFFFFCENVVIATGLAGTANLVRERTMEYVWRTVFWFQNGRPKTLEGHLNQEVFVSKKSSREATITSLELEKLHQFYQKNKNSSDSNLIFNFFYGDKASLDLSYPTFGVEEITGFDLAKAIATIE